MGHLGHTGQIWIILVNTLVVMKLGQNACLGNCSDEFDGPGERSRAIMALLFCLILTTNDRQETYLINISKRLTG
jgi:hypothetical protein